MTDMMKCGHSANATDQKTGVPVCAICIGLTPDAEIVVKPPELTGRRSRCSYFKGCKNEVDSNLNLPFFEYLPNKEFDTHYCGCYGWD